MTDHGLASSSGSANPSGKLVLAGMFLIALIIFAFEWRWHHGTHKLEFKVCLNDARDLEKALRWKSRSQDRFRAGDESQAPRIVPRRRKFTLNSLEQVLIPDDSHATLGQSAEGEVEIVIHPGIAEAGRRRWRLKT